MNSNKLDKHQYITIVGSKWFKLLKEFGLFLHIAAFVFGLLSLSSIFFNYSNEIQHILEIVTIVVVGLIIVIHSAEPFIKRIILRKLLNPFFGENSVDVKILSPWRIKDKRRLPALALAKGISINNLTVKMFWKRKGLFDKHLKYTMIFPDALYKQMEILTGVKADEDKEKHEYSETYKPSFIICDIKEKKIHMDVKFTVFNKKKEEINGLRKYAFDYKNKIVNWSGQLPNAPVFGEWSWDTKDKNEEPEIEVLHEKY